MSSTSDAASRAAEANEAALPRPRASRIFPISRTVSPSGKVTERTNTRPCSMTATTWAAVIGRSKRVLTRPQAPRGPAPGERQTERPAVAHDAGSHQLLRDRRRPLSGQDLDELLLALVALERPREALECEIAASRQSSSHDEHDPGPVRETLHAAPCFAGLAVTGQWSVDSGPCVSRDRLTTGNWSPATTPCPCPDNPAE